MAIPTIVWKNGNVRIIDQSVLPNKLRFIDCRTKEDIFHIIRTLKLRGAPAIGVAGAFGMYLGLKDSKAKNFGAFYKEARSVEKYLASSRPTARNLFWALERMRGVVAGARDESVASVKASLLEEAIAILNEDKRICRAIGENGEALIKNGDRILTHCNAGALATADFGTALAVLFKAKEKGKRFKVYADETRPVLQGARLTAWELAHEKIDATLICDNMAASLMAKDAIDKVIVGADRIALNGDVANKIGTYNVAVLCKYHDIPFYVAAPISTFDFRIKSGREIIIEERDPEEVRTVMGVSVAPKNIKVYNPAFDVTPHELVAAIITERGIIRKPFAENIKRLKNE